MRSLVVWLIVILLVIAGLLQSCSTLEKRIAKAKVIASENPKEFASFCATAYPIVPTYIKGRDSVITNTVTVKGDSIPCPEVVDQNGKTVQNKVKCPDAEYKERWHIRVDTVIKESTAKLDDLQQRFDKKAKDYDNEVKVRQVAENRASARLYWIIGLALLSLMAILMLVKTNR